MATLTETLTSLGFTDDAEAKSVAEQNAAAQNMSSGGKYSVLNVYTKGGVVVTVEQNDAPEDLGGLSAVVSHPALAIISSAKGRVAVNPDDVELVASEIQLLS